MPLTPVIGGTAPGTGLASASANVFQDFTDLFRTLAVDNIRRKREEAALAEANRLKEYLLGKKLEAQVQQEAIRQKAALTRENNRREFEAEQNRLNRENRIQYAKTITGKKADKKDKEPLLFKDLKGVDEYAVLQGIPNSIIPPSFKQEAFKKQDTSPIEPFVLDYKDFLDFRSQFSDKDFKKNFKAQHGRETLKTFENIFSMRDQATAFNKYQQAIKALQDKTLRQQQEPPRQLQPPVIQEQPPKEDLSFLFSSPFQGF